MTLCLLPTRLALGLLPSGSTAAPSSLSELPAGRLREVTLTEARWLAGESLGSENPKRSEERRVGKEWMVLTVLSASWGASFTELTSRVMVLAAAARSSTKAA